MEEGLFRSAVMALIRSAKDATTIQARGMEMRLSSGRIKECPSLSTHRTRHQFLAHFTSFLCVRVIKQIVCMFFSNPKTDERFSHNHPDLVKFVLNKNECNLNPDIRIYTFFNGGERSRHVNNAFRSKIGPEGLNRNTAVNMTREANSALVASRLLSEIACRPLGYMMSFDPAPSDFLPVDISLFARYSYYEETSISLKLPVLAVSTYFPGDYRSLKEVRHDAERYR